jgi:hypothetical protein
MSVVRQGSEGGAPTSPNTGELTTAAPFGRDGVQPTGFDVSPSGTAFAGVQVQFSSGTQYLFLDFDPATGQDHSHGPIADATTPIADIAVLPSVEFGASGYVAAEGGNATITVTRSEGGAGTASVVATAISGTALVGSDFTATSQTITFAPGETSKTFTVPVTDDTAAEEDEFFVVSLSNPAATPPTTGVTTVGAPVLGGPGAAVVRISANDDLDDVPPRITDVLLTGPSRGISGAVVHFNEDMDPTSAQNLANYSFTAKAKKKTPITLSSAVYDPVNRTVTLTAGQGFMQTQFKTLEVRVNGNGITDAAGNRLDARNNGRGGGTASFKFQVFSGTTVNFTDRDGDKATLSIANGGQIDGIMPVKAPRTQKTQFWILDPIALRSTLSGTVTKGSKGDGIVVIAEIIGLDKKEFTPLLTNTSFRVNTLTFSSNATGIG